MDLSSQLDHFNSIKVRLEHDILKISGKLRRISIP